jgi:hypothetical protein
MLNINKCKEDAFNRELLFYLKDSINNYPLGKIFNSLMINTHPITDLFADDIDKMLLAPALMMKYHDAGIISTVISFYMPGLVVNGGYTRELARLYSKKVFNNQLHSVNMEEYELKDLDIHLSSELQFDNELFIKDEMATNTLINNFNILLNIINCKILKNADKERFKDLLKKSYSVEDNISLYDMYLAIGKTKSLLTEENLALNTQMVLVPKGKHVDFICNQICIKNDYDDSYKIDPEIVPDKIQNELKKIKEIQGEYMQTYANIWKFKAEAILKKTKIELPECLVNNILSYLKTDIKENSGNEHRLGCFYLDREALSRCKKIAKMDIQDVFEQLAMDVTYFIGDCEETGCIGLVEEQDPKYKWDKHWSQNNTSIYILKNRIDKLEKHGIRILNKCCLNNPNCLWFKRNNNINTNKYKSIFNNK